MGMQIRFYYPSIRSNLHVQQSLIQSLKSSRSNKDYHSSHCTLASQYWHSRFQVHSLTSSRNHGRHDKRYHSPYNSNGDRSIHDLPAHISNYDTSFSTIAIVPAAAKNLQVVARETVYAAQFLDTQAGGRMIEWSTTTRLRSKV